MNLKNLMKKSLFLTTALTFVVSPDVYAMEDDDGIGKSGPLVVHHNSAQQNEIPFLASIALGTNPSYLWIKAEQRAILHQVLPQIWSPTLEADINGFKALLAGFQARKALEDQIPALAQIVEGHASYIWLQERPENLAALKSALPPIDSATLEADINGFKALLAEFQAQKALEDQVPGLAQIVKGHASYLWLEDAQNTQLQRVLPTIDSATLEADINAFRGLLARFEAEKKLSNLEVQ